MPTQGPQEAQAALKERKRPAQPPSHRAPTPSLPKGGGALKAIDEKFSVNPVNGTSGLSVPLPFSQARGHGPSLSLQYSSGAGNGPFGLGWSVDLPAIQRRTDKMLPRYRDAEDGDVFLLSGAEDLVPAHRRNLAGDWEPDRDTFGDVTIRRYLPRVEGLFARIEQITVAGQQGCYWKVTTRDNTVTFYGLTAAARIADPSDATRVFKWLPELAHDDKGNCFEYVYKREDLANVRESVEDRHRRSGLAPWVNTYPKRIRYGNKTPFHPDPAKPWQPTPPAAPGYFFEAVFDYGEHDDAVPEPTESGTWACRTDPFSDCRPGFEIRTWRLCRRVLFFHSFVELSPAPGPVVPCLVQSLDLTYLHLAFDNAPHVPQEADLVTAIGHSFYKRNGAGYDRRNYPSLELDYYPMAWNKAVRSAAPEDVVNAPTGGAGPGYRFVDLYGEGVSGILAEQGDAWYYKSNLGGGHFSRAATVMRKPSLTGVDNGVLQIQDLDADGSKQVVVDAPGMAGYFELGDDGQWRPFRAFRQVANVPAGDPNARFIDLNGDGKADLLVTEDVVIRWFPSLGRDGYDAAQQSSKPLDEERGPALLLADGTQTIFLADMSGDGLTDIVRVRNADICYWPNLGYGRFGAKVTMRNAPLFDTPEHFDPAAIRLFDVSGTGAADLIYLGKGAFTAWINLAGNAWSEPQSIDPFPGTESPNKVAVLDLLGNGTGCVVWSSELPANAGAPLRYVDLMGGRKPYLLHGYRNNLGAQTLLEYRSSSYYYLRDRAENQPWVTRLPFPTLCVSRHETSDSVSGLRFVREYRYRHGYYDHAEREFRGFGMVEQVDTEDFARFSASGAGNVVDATVHQAPVRTRSWFHTGAFIDGPGLLRQFGADYFRNGAVPEYLLPDPPVDGTPAGGLTPEERRQAARACKGTLLRQEVYADDGTPLQALPYSCAEHSCRIRMLQPQLGNRYAVFLTHASEAVTYHYERNPTDARVEHTLNTVVDDIGNVLESATVTYGRLAPDPALPLEVQQEQSRLTVLYGVSNYTHDVRGQSAYRLRQSCESLGYEVTGKTPAAAFFTLDEIRTAFAGAADLGYEEAPHAGLIERRLLDHHRTLFASDADPTTPLPLGSLESLGLTYQSYSLAFTPGLLTALYGGRVDAAMLAEGHYIRAADWKALGRFPTSDPDDHYWAASGTVQFPADPGQHFYLPQAYVDATGAATTVRYYADYQLMVDRTEDALGNRITVEAFDFRFLVPLRSRDINDNLSAVALDILGLVTGTAVLGKGAQADDLVGFAADLTDAQVQAFLADPVAHGAALLGNATSRFVYRFTAAPIVAATISRETHRKQELASGTPSKLQYGFEFSDGSGHVVMKKLQAEPGRAKHCVVNPDGSYTITEIDTTPNRRWIGSGRTVLNNKGNPVLQYEPYFSTTPAFESAPELVESGVSPVLFYDSIGRMTRTQFPDGTFSRIVFDSWQKQSFDANDNVLASDWYAARVGGGLGAAEQSAALKTALHDDTPAVVHFDTHGRAHYAVAHNRFIDRSTSAVVEEFHGTRSEFDIEGNTTATHDPRGNTVMRYAYDMLGQQGFSDSMDGGARRMLHDALGKALYGWDALGNRFHSAYDVLHRPVRHEVLRPGALVALVTDRSEYGTDKTLNQNGQVIKRHDPAGILTHEAYDFDGNLLRGTQQFTASASDEIDWTTPAAVVPDPRVFVSTAQFDALKRAVETVAPDGSRTRNHYNESNLLDSVEVGVRGEALQTFINRISHDVKGQRQTIDYGNGTSTAFTYDPLTFRVRTIVTTRLSDGVRLQDLRYAYDPSGNITSIDDAAQQSAFFNNAVVSPSGGYVYDAMYQLRSATGREQIGLNAAPDALDVMRTHLPHKSDGSALQNYLEQYEYDGAGNMTAMSHAAGAGIFTNRWTRTFTLAAANNRLATSTVGGVVENFGYDGHGNLTAMPHLAVIGWNVDNQLRTADLGGGGTVWYCYDADGRRARKRVQRIGGLVEERLYMGTLEIFRRILNGVIVLERETFHVMDRDRRLAIVDTRTAGADSSLPRLVRYQFGNHLGTASLELDDLGAIIGYEEYYPFGSTSFQSVDSAREVPAKRYRYTGKERDEETGLYYHGTRYYAPWLARWSAPDPLGVKDGNNRYLYAGNRPIGSSDPTGMWETPSWRTVAVIAAVVVVGVAVTVLTAGLAGPAIAAGATAAAGSIGLGATGAAVLSGAAVGAVAGAAGGLASGVVGETTRQAVNSRALGLGTGEFSGRAIARAGAEGMVTGLIGGAVTGGIAGGLAQAARGGALGARLATHAVSSGNPSVTAVSRAASMAIRAGRLARDVGIGAASGSGGAAASELTRQVINREDLSGRRILGAAGTGAVLGGVVPLGIAGVRGLQGALARGSVRAISGDVAQEANAMGANLRGDIPRGTQVLNSHGSPGAVRIAGVPRQPISQLAPMVEENAARNVIIRACRVAANDAAGAPVGPDALRSLAEDTQRTITAFTESPLVDSPFMNSAGTSGPLTPTTFVPDTNAATYQLQRAVTVGLVAAQRQATQ